METCDLNISEDPVVYSAQEVKSLLQRIAEGNRATGGLSVVAKAYGIAGNFYPIYHYVRFCSDDNSSLLVALRLLVSKYKLVFE